MTRPVWTALMFALALCSQSTAHGTGLLTCPPTDKAEWLTKEALTEKLEAEGWTIRFVKEDGGCWEAYGNNPDGLRVEAYFHPVSGDVLLINQRGKILFKADGV